MSQSYRFTVAINPNLPTEQRDALLQTLRSQQVELHEVESREPATITILAILSGVVLAAKGVKEVAGAANEVIKLAEKINEWRARSRASGVAPEVQFERPGAPPLDLATASDARVLAWFLEQQG